MSSKKFGMRKKFEQAHHDKFDDPARDTAKSWWASLGWDIKDNPDKYGVDLIAEKEGKRVYVEVEVKRVWHGAEFTYDTLHVPYRKTKFLDKPTKFMIFNASRTHAAVIGRAAVRKAPVIEVPNRTIGRGEKFYNIPVSDVSFVFTLT